MVEQGSPKTTDDIVLERPEESRTRRRHKTESVKQPASQDRILEQGQAQRQASGPSFCPFPSKEVGERAILQA